MPAGGLRELWGGGECRGEGNERRESEPGWSERERTGRDVGEGE